MYVEFEVSVEYAGEKKNRRIKAQVWSSGEKTWVGDEALDTQQLAIATCSSSHLLSFIYWALLFFKGFIYLRERMYNMYKGGAEREVEADSSLSREPNAGLHPTILGSWPEPKGRHLTNWATQRPCTRHCLNCFFSSLIVFNPHNRYLISEETETEVQSSWCEIRK